MFLPLDSIKRKSEVRFPGLSVETTNYCNANCVFCAYRYMRRPKGRMPMELFEKIVREYAEIGGGRFFISGSAGEPLLDAQILQRISLARAHDNIRPIMVYTNGVLLNKVGAKNLLDSGMHAMRISIAGHNREAYKKLSGVDEFDRVSANVVELLEMNNCNGRKVEIIIDLRADVSMGKVVKEKAIQELRKLTNQIDYQIFYHNWGGAVPSKEIPKTMVKERMRRRKTPCRVLYRAPRILWNGDLSACNSNVNADPGLILGNVRDSHIVRLWQSQARKELLARFARADPPESCLNCSRYGPFPGELRARTNIKHIYNVFLSSDYFRRMKAES